MGRVGRNDLIDKEKMASRCNKKIFSGWRKRAQS